MMLTAAQLAEARAIREKLDAAAKEEEDRRTQAAALKEVAGATVQKGLEMGSFDGEKMTIAAATVARANTFLRDIALFIRMLGWRGNFKTRRMIDMTEEDLDEYVATMTREVSILATDAVVFEAFLLMQDDKLLRRRGWRGRLERRLLRKRAPLFEQWDRFSRAVKRSIYIVQGAKGPYPHIPERQEVPDDEERRGGADAPGGEEELQGVGAGQGEPGQVPGGGPGAGGGNERSGPGGAAPGGGAGDGAAAPGGPGAAEGED